MTKWQRRARLVGFVVLDNKRLQDMSDDEIKEAFEILSRRYGISYIWH